MKTKLVTSAVSIFALLFLCLPAQSFNLKKHLGIPDPVLDQLGSLMYAAKMKQCEPCERKEDLENINAVWAKMLASTADSPPYKKANAKNWQWEIALIKEMEIADAEAFPGGKVIVTSLASACAKKDPSQIAFLLGHEMAHALARHAKSRFDSHTQAAIMTAVVGGKLNASKLDPSVTIAAMAAMGVSYEGAVVKPFTKKQEFEADRNALITMARAGFDPQASVAYLTNVESVTSKTKQSFMDDHPPLDERVASLNKHMGEALQMYRQVKG